ncbi:MAG: LysR family transcriptional regulator [Rhodobacteraceae bacterium]|nr:LysR family transcriptional regulator [Paracoccaceae bacterium]
MARIPSTQALRALESFARMGTVWQAAEELNLTRSAVCHQLRLLERDLDFALVTRVGTHIELTPQGQSYAADIRQALQAIAGSAVRNAERGVAGKLTVSCAPGFAASWLCNKLGRFNAAFPDVELTIVTPKRLGEVTSPEVDLFISYGFGTHPEMEVEHLQDVVSTPLCSPALANRLGAMTDPADALRGRLLHLADHEDWQAWVQLAGMDPTIGASGVIFSDMHLVYAAAQAGQGIVMGDVVLSEDALNEGRLVRLFELTVRSPRSYFLVAPPQRLATPAAAAFRGWLLEERRKAQANGGVPGGRIG